MNRRLRGGISAVVCTLVLAGCGGGGGGDSAATPAAAQNDNQPAKVAAPKIADVGITPTSALRPGTQVNFIVSGVFPSTTTYVWDFGDSTPSSNGVSAKHTYSKVGTFSVKVTATDASGQKSIETRSVVIVANQPPVITGAVSLGQGTTGVIALGQGGGGVVNIGQVEATGPAVTIVVNATDPQGDSLTYKWLIDGVAYGQATANNTLSYSFSTGTTHALTVIVTNEYGGQTSQDFHVSLVSPVGPILPLEPGGYALWKASYTAQSVGRIRVAADKTAWALPIGKPQVLKSTDNGRSWQELTLPKDDDGKGGNGFIDIAFVDDKNIWVVGCPQQKYLNTANGAVIQFDYAAAMHSSNGGNSWENVRLAGFPDDRCMRAVQFIGQNGWVVNERGIVANTTDSGKTWNFQADTDMDALRMQFIDARNGWIIGADRNGSNMQIARTTDGGATWTSSQPQGATVNPYASVFFVDAKTGYASGSQWSRAPYPVLKSIDGGVTWNALAVPKNTFITDLAFTTPTYGYALDMFGDVYGTKDGGLNWAKIGVASLGANVALTSFALGDNTALLGTSASTGGGGALWLTPL